MRILDSTAGTRSIWYQKQNPFTMFLDKRNIKEYRKDEINKGSHTQRIMKIYPDIQAKWSNIPFIDECFDVVIFDPPHLIKERDSKKPSMVKMYGVLYKDNWKQEIEISVKELFRVLKPNGMFILKWCECDKPITDILPLIPYNPMFGTRTGQRNNNHWIHFIKHKSNAQLSDFY